jgi:hypothetical protein
VVKATRTNQISADIGYVVRVSVIIIICPLTTGPFQGFFGQKPWDCCLDILHQSKRICQARMFRINLHHAALQYLFLTITTYACVRRAAASLDLTRSGSMVSEIPPNIPLKGWSSCPRMREASLLRSDPVEEDRSHIPRETPSRYPLASGRSACKHRRPARGGTDARQHLIV